MHFPTCTPTSATHVETNISGVLQLYTHCKHSIVAPVLDIIQSNKVKTILIRCDSVSQFCVEKK